MHLSNPYAREEWRRHSVVSPVVDGTVTDDTWAAVDIGKAKERLGFFNTRDDAFAAADAYISRLP